MRSGTSPQFVNNDLLTMHQVTHVKTREIGTAKTAPPAQIPLHLGQIRNELAH